MRKLTVTWENRHREPDKRTYIVRRDDTRTFAVFTVDIPVDDSQLRALLEDAADRLYALEEEINERCH